MIDWFISRLIYRHNRQYNGWRKLHLLLSAAIFLCSTCLFLNVGTSPAFAVSLQEIQQRGYITVAVKDNLPPLAFRDENGDLQGLEIEIAQRLAKDLLNKSEANNSEKLDKLDKLVKFKPVTNQQRLKAVEKGEVDMAIAKVTATPSRQRIVNFSVPYYFDGGIVAIKNTSFQKLSDLENSKIAVLKNSSTIAALRYYLPKAELVGVDSYLEGQRLIDNNQVAAFAADITSLSNWIKQNPQYRLLPTKISTQPLSVVMPKGLQYDELRRKVSLLIGSYLQQGWLKERAQYWGLPMDSYQLSVNSEQ
ncbi:amino acid ABC transporter substrate-binding protein, PAAT family [Rivularia sp. PCC 7116]|uniref:transporter substrate-binding domain-containing protein n=1 Tax=Rivularia sp. PCC 7116 TaxID=373994 RepID=UPI00029F3554|nr:transporter substrate-binding domain-containing protein [Rivularia sp. PCC 7116]AFY57767.1 amino acid ABC transporter substrate-binding protein, PAAT family [Rivularia sp. PCC 7116]